MFVYFLTRKLFVSVPKNSELPQRKRWKMTEMKIKRIDNFSYSFYDIVRVGLLVSKYGAHQ